MFLNGTYKKAKPPIKNTIFARGLFSVVGALSPKIESPHFFRMWSCLGKAQSPLNTCVSSVIVVFVLFAVIPWK